MVMLRHPLVARAELNGTGGLSGASLLFGAATALQYVFQTLGLDLPYQLFLMLPYGLTLLALAGAVGRARPPADLGRDEGGI